MIKPVKQMRKSAKGNNQPDFVRAVITVTILWEKVWMNTLVLAKKKRRKLFSLQKGKCM